jgi:hypothetical protein
MTLDVQSRRIGSKIKGTPMPSVRLRFVNDNNFVSRIIRGAQMGFLFVHVEAVRMDGSYLGSRADGGVLARPVDYDPSWTQQLFVDIPCSQAQADAFHLYLTLQVGTPYDMEAIAEMAEGVLSGHEPVWDGGRRTICSALIISALQDAKLVYGAPGTSRLTTPRDVLYQCAALTAIGEPQSNPIHASKTV